MLDAEEFGDWGRDDRHGGGVEVVAGGEEVGGAPGGRFGFMKHGR